MDQLEARFPDLITVTEQHAQSVRSANADIRVTMERNALRKAGSSPMTGPISDLRERLRGVGVAEDQIAIDQVRTESRGWSIVVVMIVVAIITAVIRQELIVGSVVAGVPLLLHMLGLLEWPYHATCVARILARDAAQAKAVVDLVTAMPNATLSGVHWRYDFVQPSSEWVDVCITRANERARRIATGLDVTILGVHSYAERWRLPNREVAPVITGQAIEEAGMTARYSKGSGSPELETEGDASVTVTVSYRVASSPPQGT